MMALHEAAEAAATVLTAVMEQPAGYGRIIRGEDGGVLNDRGTEGLHREEAAVHEINTGTYCFDNAKLFAALEKVTNRTTSRSII